MSQRVLHGPYSLVDGHSVDMSKVMSVRIKLLINDYHNV